MAASSDTLTVYFQTHQHENDAEFVEIAHVPMATVPVRGDIIEIRDYYEKSLESEMSRESFVSLHRSPYLFVERVLTLFDKTRNTETVFLIVTSKKMPAFFR